MTAYAVMLHFDGQSLHYFFLDYKILSLRILPGMALRVPGTITIFKAIPLNRHAPSQAAPYPQIRARNESLE